MSFEPTSGSTARRSVSELRAQGPDTKERSKPGALTPVDRRFAQSKSGRSEGESCFAAFEEYKRGCNSRLREGDLELSYPLVTFVWETSGAPFENTFVCERARKGNACHLIEEDLALFCPLIMVVRETDGGHIETTSVCCTIMVPFSLFTSLARCHRDRRLLSLL